MIRVTDMDALADEFVLGLLDQADVHALQREMERNAELRQAVARSRERFLPLDMTASPAPISSDLWTKIEEQMEASAASPAPSPRATPKRSPTPPPPTANDNAIKKHLTFWRATALSGLAASLLLVATLGWSLTRTVEPMVMAVLVNEAGDVQAVVEDFGSERAVVRLLADVSVPADRTMQVWTLPSKETGPVSMGLLPQSRSARLEPPSLPSPKDAQLYEITLEPAGGSPTGRPTGPILAKGFAKLTR